MCFFKSRTPHRYIFLIFILICFSCSREYLPKPKGYNRIDLPSHEYVNSPDSLPYFFKVSKHARISRDSSWIAMNRIKEKIDPDVALIKEKYWIDISYEALGANIEITYKAINKHDDLMKAYLTDAYRLTSEHQVKASAIDESIIRTANGYTVSFVELKGEVPTQVQFVTTDSVQNFLRGALYFKTATMNDSLAPVITYLKEDILYFLNTLRWK
jgi:gliding motility-associated lipoprotein GldD